MMYDIKAPIDSKAVTEQKSTTMNVEYSNLTLWAACRIRIRHALEIKCVVLAGG